MTTEENIFKSKIFKIPHYNQTISQYQESLSFLEPQEKHQIKRGPFKSEYQRLVKCESEVLFTQKADCYKETLHSFCVQNFKEFVQCQASNRAANGQKKKKCDPEVIEYFLCIDRNMKNVLWSSSLNM